MKIKLLKPLYLDSVVVSVGAITERDELHARELIAKGYAELVDESNTPDSTPETKGKKSKS